ncbi:MAG: formimidoylglutamase [Cyclobacteriaceae bacterium]|nr:formimidoylglutamase [Cyclobacteriaceae bacterium]
MDLKIFFTAIDDTIVQSIDDIHAFYHSIRVNTHEMPDFKQADIALIGLEEERGTLTNKGATSAADEIRSKLYRLKSGMYSYRIADLGNLRNGMTLEETQLRIKEVCGILLEHNVLPVLIGGTHDLDYGQFMAYEHMDKLISILNVDAFLDLEETERLGASRQHIHKMLLHEPNYLFNYNQLGHQSYLIDPVAISLLEKLYFDVYRLGLLKENIHEMEPVIRNADMMTFDITAIKSSDACGNANAQPFGLSGEEACQVCWYAGLNEKLSSAGFYEYNPDYDDEHQSTARVVATMIWYFIEGFYNRKSEQNFKSNDYLRYVVSIDNDPGTIVFYKSKLSEKWWMEVNYPQGKEKYARNCIVPCSYVDYQAANSGEVPERWISTHAKLI